MGPTFFHVVLYEYFRVYLNTPFKNSTLYLKWKNIYGSKVVLSGEPSKNKMKVPKNKIQNQKWFQKYDFEPFLVQLRTLFGLVF